MIIIIIIIIIATTAIIIIIITITIIIIIENKKELSLKQCNKQKYLLFFAKNIFAEISIQVFN